MILCDICLRMAAHKGCVDVYAAFEYLRSRRCNMVQNVEQYRLAHLIILNCLIGDPMSTVVPITNNITQHLKQLPGIDKQLDYINECQWQHDALVQSRYPDGIDENFSLTDGKNRFSHILPGKYTIF